VPDVANGELLGKCSFKSLLPHSTHNSSFEFLDTFHFKNTYVGYTHGSLTNVVTLEKQSLQKFHVAAHWYFKSVLKDCQCFKKGCL